MIMKRISIVGLCLMAVIAISAVMVSSAFAAQPEFKTSTFPVSFKSESLLPLQPLLASIVSGAHVNISCEMSEGKGELTNATTVGKALVLYRGCKVEEGAGTKKCTSPTLTANSGLIRTLELEGTTGEIGGGSTAGILFKPSGGAKDFATFTCEGTVFGTITVIQSVIGEAKPFKLGEASTLGELIFEENAAKNGQKWANFVGGPICELAVNTTTNKAWIMDRQLITFSAAVELT